MRHWVALCVHSPRCSRPAPLPPLDRMAAKVLIACTSGTQLLDGRPTGCWVEEVATPYLLWREKGIQVWGCSTCGGGGGSVHLVLTFGTFSPRPGVGPASGKRRFNKFCWGGYRRPLRSSIPIPLQVDICSIAGGAVPWDASSTSGDFFTAQAAAFLNNGQRRGPGQGRLRQPADKSTELAPPPCCTAETAAKLIKETPSVEELLARGIDSYDALFLPGGHGIAIDGTSDSLKQLVEQFWGAGKVVSGGSTAGSLGSHSGPLHPSASTAHPHAPPSAAVCHGPCGLVTATVPGSGDSILKGNQASAAGNGGHSLMYIAPSAEYGRWLGTL